MSRKRKKPITRKYPEIQVIRQLWAKCRYGDESAANQLLAMLNRYHSPDAFVKRFEHMKENENVGIRDSQLITDKPVTNSGNHWGKIQAKSLHTGKIHVVSGGLPSLGKTSK